MFYLLVLVAFAPFATLARFHPPLELKDAAGPPPRALYFITEQQTTGQVAALPIDQNGRVSAGSLTPLGSGPPANQTELNLLTSQYSIIVVGNYLFSVSGGSNTLNMFEIDSSDPTTLTRIGKPITTEQYPISIAASLKQSLVCVANNGDTVAGLACASFDGRNGISKLDAVRPYFTPQTVPDSGTIGQVGALFFNNDESALYTTIKGNFGSPARTFISVFPLSKEGVVSRTQIANYPKDVQFLYGSQFIPGTDAIFAADLSNAAIIDADSFSSAITQYYTTIPNNTCSCWTAYSKRTGTGFVSDPLNPRIAELDLHKNKLIAQPPASPGMLDIAAAGNYVYALSAGDLVSVPPQIAVFDVSGGRGTIHSVQTFSPAGISIYSQGLALYTGSH